MRRIVGDKEYTKLAELLRKARLEAGLTQIEAAEKFGQPQSRISEIEKGQRRVDFIEIKKLSKIYKKEISYFT